MEDTPVKEIDLPKLENTETIQNQDDENESMPKYHRGSSRQKTKKQTIKQMIRAQKINDLQKSSTINVVQDPYQKLGMKEKIAKLVGSTVFSVIMSAITIYALFADDIRVIATDKDADPVFWGISCFCLAAFTNEIVLSSISQPGYFLGFFFWLDVMSTVSLILDIGWISNEIFQTNQKGSASSVASLAKASRASRVGTRAGRIVRVVRLVRLVRLYKHAQLALSKQAKKFEMEQKKLMEEQRRRQQEQRSDSIASQNNLPHQFEENGIQSGIRSNKSPHMSALPQNMLLNEENLDPRFSSPPLKGDQERKGRLKTVMQRQEIDGRINTVIVPGNKIVPQPLELDQKVKSSLSQNYDKQENDEENQRQDRRQLSVSRDRRSSYSQSMSLNASSHGISSSSSTQATKLANQETKVGKTLSDLTTRRVISIVLLIMFSMPIFTVDTYTETPTSFQGGLNIIYLNKGIQNLYSQSLTNYIDFHKTQRSPLIRLDIDNLEKYPLNDSNIPNFQDLRNDDLNYYTYADSNGNVVATSISNQRDDNVLDAILSIIRTIFVSVVLTIASVKFTSDVEIYILEPIEKMLQKVKRISQNPLEAAQMEEKEQFAIEQLEEEGNEKELQKIRETEKYETVVLEKLIIRVGALLALGFGEAGSEIIAKNMSNNGIVDPMLPGNKIMAIFGFCDIRNFTDATEVLQQGVMIFVNEIAQITHSTVDQYLGQANKNIGDAFLLVWKFRDQDYLKNLDGGVEFLKNDITSNYADCSVLSFIKIMAAITLSNKLRKYKHHPGLQKRLKGYRVKMGFGLHFGWAIEGAIGSDFKIDASYLSPNVNMASRLEAATKQFGTGLLISGPLREILTEKLQKQLRKIDCVTVKGSIVPLDLYTCDVNLERLYDKRKGKDPFDFSNFTDKQLKKKKILDKMKRNAFKNSVFKHTTIVADEFDTDPDLKEMRKEYTKEFYHIWEKGYQCYHDGKWVEAAQFIKQTLMWFQFRQDGPSQTLYEFIKENNYVAPRDWKGFRVLTEK